MRCRVFDGVRSLLARHLPGYDVESVAKLGEGWDNVVCEVNADLIVRASKEPDVVRRRDVT